MDLLEKQFYENEKNVKNQQFVRHPWELAREKIIKHLISKKFKNKAINLMDVGCGDGYIISSVAKANPQAGFSGVDIELISSMQKEMNEQAPPNLSFYQSMEDASSEMKYDGFTLMDVIEHVEDDVGLLKQLRNLPSTKPDALFFITVPAWQFLFTGHDVFLKHFRRYTIKKLRHSTVSANLKEVEMHYFFFSLFVVRCLKKGIAVLFKKEEEVPVTDLVWNHGNRTAKITAEILYIEYLLMRFLSRFGIHLPGLSVLGICKKEA